jgi:hypothetical protein
VASFGHIQGTHYQNLHDFEPYVKAVEGGALPVYRALEPTPEERLIREFVLQLKTGRVSRDYFRRKFGADPGEQFAAPLATLQDWGFAETKWDEIRLNRRGCCRWTGCCTNSSSPNTGTAVMRKIDVEKRTLSGFDPCFTVNLPVQPIVYPMDSFYAQAGRTLPLIEAITGDQMPEPFRSLLVHEVDMTSTLERYHKGRIELSLISLDQRDDFYFRALHAGAGGAAESGSSLERSGST